MNDKLSPKKKEIVDFVMSSNAGRKMLERRAKSMSTKLIYSRGCQLLHQFVNKPLDDIVNEYVADVKANMYQAADKWEEVFAEFITWLRKHDFRSATVAAYYNGAKALINANVPRSMRLQAETPKYSSRTVPGVSIEDLREIYAMCDERERAFIAILKDSGISGDDALRLNYGDVKGFEKQEFVHINMYRAKEDVEYETFIGPNAVQALRAHTTVREQRGQNITDDIPIFASDKTPYGRLDGDALFQLFMRVSRKTGKKIRSHMLRKFFETYMALTVRHPIILKYWMGHKIRGKGDIEARYIIPPTPEQLTLYKESYRNIDLAPKPSPENLLKAEVKARLEAMDPEARRRFAAEIATVYREHAGRILAHPDIKELLEEENTETNGGDCGEQFEQINEANLLQYLRQGWKVVHRLQNGEVIVRKG